jgi:hypothetical protein
MKIYNNIYCTRGSLAEILILSKHHKELFKLIKICNVIVELSDEEMQNLILLPKSTEENIELYSFFKEKSTFHNNNPGIFKLFENEERLQKEIDTISNDIFIVDLSEIECENIRNKYGLFVISSENKDYIKKFNEPPDGWCWEKGETLLTDPFTNTKIQINEWKNLFSGIEVHKIIPPFNSIIINDQYLFQNFKDKETLQPNPLSTNNLKSLIEGLLPKKLCIEFNVLLVCGSVKTFYDYKTGTNKEEIILDEKDIQSILTNLQTWSAKFIPKKITFSIITVDIIKDAGKGFHSRAIYFNHGLSISNYGFINFKEGKPFRENDINMKWSYNSINSEIFNIMPIHKMIKFKEVIKDIIRSDNRFNNTFKFIKSKNRLLNFIS